MEEEGKSPRERRESRQRDGEGVLEAAVDGPRRPSRLLGEVAARLAHALACSNVCVAPFAWSHMVTYQCLETKCPHVVRLLQVPTLSREEGNRREVASVAPEVLGHSSSLRVRGRRKVAM